MAHKHPIYDSDAHFIIDGLTRTVKNVSETKTMLVQYDHNSERFTFEVPRYVDGHDLSLCNAVRVHYINIEKSKRTENKGVYEVTDLQVSPEDDKVVVCSWVISGNATQLVGALQFVVQFACVEDGEVVYSWNTARHGSVSITDGIYNGDDIEEEYADILQQWYQKLVEADGGNIDLNTGDAVKLWSGTSEEYEQNKETLPEGCIVFLQDAPTTADLASGDFVVGKASKVRTDMEFKWYTAGEEIWTSGTYEFRVAHGGQLYCAILSILADSETEVATTSWVLLNYDLKIGKCVYIKYDGTNRTIRIIEKVYESYVGDSGEEWLWVENDVTGTQDYTNSTVRIRYRRIL